MKKRTTFYENCQHKAHDEHQLHERERERERESVINKVGERDTSVRLIFKYPAMTEYIRTNISFIHSVSQSVSQSASVLKQHETTT